MTGARRSAVFVLVGALVALVSPIDPAGAEAPAVVACGEPHWVGVWSTSQDNADAALEGQTGRMMISPHFGGDVLRIRFSNEQGTTPVQLTSVHVGMRAAGAAVQEGTQTPVTFGSADGVTIPAGGTAASDPVHFSFRAFDELAVSYYVASTTGNKATGHFNAEQVSYLASGDVAASPSADGFLNGQTSWWYLDGVDVLTGDDVSNVVLFGDSITEGFQSTRDGQARYPDVLAQRIVAAGLPLAVLNEGLSGNRVLHDGIASPVGGGMNGKARFARDVLTTPAPTAVLMQLGINDIGHPAVLLDPSQKVTAREIIAGLADIVRQARAAGLRTYGATLTPAGDLSGPSPLGPNYSSPEANQKRKEINDWIRTPGSFDGVVDFDEMLRDPVAPEHLRAEYNSGDSLHPNDAGYAAMANGIDLAMFPTRACASGGSTDGDTAPILPATGVDADLLLGTAAAALALAARGIRRRLS